MFSTSSAPAKAILVGEHAVVHGQPAIALPLSQLRAYVDSRETDLPLRVSSSISSSAPFSWRQGEAASTVPLKRAVELTARRFAASALKGELVIRSDIPIAGGLGSGAAVSAALARGLAALLGRDLTKADLNSIVYEVEKLHHGMPSGIDNTVIVYEKPVFYVKDQPIDFIEINCPLTLVLGDTGVPSLTRAAVADVRDQLEREPRRTQQLFAQIGAIAARAKVAVLAGDHRQLGKLMTQNHRLLRALDVSSDLLDRLVEASLRAGAYGAKLSGGGRGGVMIALAPPDAAVSIKQALTRAGASGVIVSSVGGEMTRS